MTSGGTNKNETKLKTYLTSLPWRSFSSPRRYTFSTIICLTTKSGEFAFD